MKPIQGVLRWGFMRLEGWLDRVFTPAWNPMYQLGALGYFYFWIVAASGLYVYIFFDTGLTEAYQSIEDLTHGQWYLGGVMRSLHRYASDALVVMMVLHMLREFAFDHYRGARFFSWVTGVPMTWLIIAAGITGYWLVWDMLAQYVAVVSSEWLDWLPIFGEPIARNFTSPQSLDDRFFTLMIFIHIAVPLVLLLVMWIHLQRVTYAKWNPPRGLAVGTILMMLVLSLAQPAVSHAPADLNKVPQVLDLDWFYLFAYPLIEMWDAGPVWGLAFGVTLLLILIPWLPPGKKTPPAVVSLENCNGCSRCAADCPFGAIAMLPRTDGRPFQREAVVDPSVCVSCGICAGACPTSMPFRRLSALIPGIDLPDLTVAEIRDRVEAAGAVMSGDDRVLIFGCKRGVGARRLAEAGGNGKNRAFVELECSGQLPPIFIDYVLSRGFADGVAVVGCRTGECHYRLGPEWSEQRFRGQRDPNLRRRVPLERLARIWAAPTDRRRAERELAAFQATLTALPKEVPRTRAAATAAASDEPTPTEVEP